MLRLLLGAFLRLLPAVTPAGLTEPRRVTAEEVNMVFPISVITS